MVGALPTNRLVYQVDSKPIISLVNQAYKNLIYNLGLKIDRPNNIKQGWQHSWNEVQDIRWSDKYWQV